MINSAPNKTEKVLNANSFSKKNVCYYEKSISNEEQDYYYKLENPNLNKTIFIQYLSVNSFSLHHSNLDIIKYSGNPHGTFTFQLDQNITEYYLKINVNPNIKYAFCITAFPEKANKIEYKKEENRTYAFYEIITSGKYSFYLQNVTSNLYGFRILNDHLKNYKKPRIKFIGLYSDEMNYTLDISEYFIVKNYTYFPLEWTLEKNEIINESYLDIHLRYKGKKPDYYSTAELLEVELVDIKDTDEIKNVFYYELIKCNKDYRKEEKNNYYFGKIEGIKQNNSNLLKEVSKDVFSQKGGNLEDDSHLKYSFERPELMMNLNNKFPTTVNVSNDVYNLEFSFKTPFSGYFNISIIMYTDIKNLNYNNICDLYQFSLNLEKIEKNKLAIVNRDVKVGKDLYLDILIDKTFIRHLDKKGIWEAIVIAKSPKFPNFFIVYEPYFNDPKKNKKYLRLLDTNEGNKVIGYFYVIIFTSVAIASSFLLCKSYMKKSVENEW